jgi:hypothetical protein
MAAFLEINTNIPAGGCPVSCTFCPTEKAADEYDKRSDQRLMSFETFAACLAKMPPGTSVSFAGFTEPWLNNRCTEMAEHCHAKGVQWEAYTTCVGMTLDDVDRLVAAKPIRVKLHLADEERYAKIRVDADYVAVVTTLADKLGPACSVMTMGTLVPELRQRFGKILPNNMHSRAGNVSPLVKLTPPRKRGPLRCRPGPALDRNILLPDGSLTLCCFDFSQRHVIGNLLTQTWEEIRNGPALAGIRAAMASEDGDVLCRTCEVAISAGEKVRCA